MDRCRRLPRGMSLIEVVAVMGANAALMAAAIGALLAVGHADRRFARRMNDSTSVASLLERLRADIHACDSIRWDEELKTLELKATGGGATEYRLDSQRLERWTVEPDDDGDAGNPLERKRALTSAFRLPNGMRIAVEPASVAAGELVSVTLQPQYDHPQPDRQPPQAPMIYVAVGKDARLLHE